MPQQPIWFNQATVSNLHVYLDALEKDIGTHGKQKYLEPLNIIKEKIAALEKLNQIVKDHGGPLMMETSDTPAIDSNINLIYIKELNDAAVTEIITAIKNSAQHILDVSKKEFTATNEKGIRLVGLMGVCDQLSAAHNNKKILEEMAFFSAQFNASVTKGLPMEDTTYIVWFDKSNIEKLETALGTLLTNLPNNKKIAALPDSDNPFTNAPHKEIADKHLRPDIAELVFDKNPVLNALNIIQTSLQQLKNINAKVFELGAFTVEQKKGKFELQFSEHRLEDTTITTLRGNLHQAFNTIEAHLGHLDIHSPERIALSILKEAEPFIEHRKMKNLIELEYYKAHYVQRFADKFASKIIDDPVRDQLPPEERKIADPKTYQPTTEPIKPELTVPDIIHVAKPTTLDTGPIPDPDSLVKIFNYKPNLEDMFSTLLPDSPVIASSREHGFLDESKLEVIKAMLEKSGYSVSDTKLVDKEAVREITIADHKSFTLSNREMKTTDTDIETFKTMLRCFEATHNKLPIIITANDALKEKWMTACKAVFPERKIDFDSMITIKKSTKAETPAPEPTPDEPSNHIKMRR